MGYAPPKNKRPDGHAVKRSLAFNVEPSSRYHFLEFLHEPVVEVAGVRHALAPDKVHAIR